MEFYALTIIVSKLKEGTRYIEKLAKFYEEMNPYFESNSDNEFNILKNQIEDLNTTIYTYKTLSKIYEGLKRDDYFYNLKFSKILSGKLLLENEIKLKDQTTIYLLQNLKGTKELKVLFKLKIIIVIFKVSFLEYHFISFNIFLSNSSNLVYKLLLFVSKESIYFIDSSVVGYIPVSPTFVHA
jgi:hypothetical protein